MTLAVPSLQERVGNWVDHPRQQAFIIGVILFNAVTLGLETVPELQQTLGGVLHLIDQVIIAIFVFEIVLKLYAYQGRFFRSPWNVFDFLIVTISLVPATATLSILRTLRIFRVLRLLNKIPRLRAIVESMLRAIPSIGWVSLMLLLVFYIFAVIGTSLFGTAFPDWFGNIGAATYTLFQIMTLESWSMGIARPVMEQFPYAFLYFIPFILVATYSMLNLFIAIIVNTMQSIGADSTPADSPSPEHAELLREVRELRAQMAQFEVLLRTLERPVTSAPGRPPLDSGSDLQV